MSPRPTERLDPPRPADARRSRRPAPGEVPTAPAAAGVSERRWLPLNALRAFEAVGRRLSFTQAAAALHVSQSALSRHVARLEDLLGRRLLERHRHGLSLTPAGAALLPVVTKSFDRIEGTFEALRRDGGGGRRTLRVHMPPSFLHQLGLAALGEFRAAVPDILVDVSSSNGVGLPSGPEVDVAVVFDRPHVEDTVRDLLWTIRNVPACAPALAARGAGLTLAEFLGRNVLLHIKHEGLPPDALWAGYARHHRLDIAPGRGLAFDTGTLAARCAMAGDGVMLADTRMFAREIADGRLAVPFDAPYESGHGYYLALHPEDLADPAVALFRSWVIDRVARP